MSAAIEHSKLSNKKLPTNWIAPKKPPYRESILNDEEIKVALLSHQKLPSLDRKDAEKMKNNLKKQLSIEMLIEGYHKSFRELDFILKLQIEDRHRLGSEHPIWDKPLLDQEPEKLTYLCKKLNRTEAADRDGKSKSVYINYHDLASYFLLRDDTWLSDYFYEKCLFLTQNKENNLDVKHLAEAHCNLGLAYERRNAYFKAMEHFQEYYNLVKGNDWKIENHFEDLSKKDIEKVHLIKKNYIEENIRNLADEKMFTDSCIHLQRIYKIMSTKYARNIDEKIEYLSKVLEVCKSSSIKTLEGQSSFLLGNAYTENSKLEIALSCYNNYYEISKNERDLENFGKASEALAKCHEKLGNVNKSIEFLQKYLAEVSNNEADKQYARACSCLANIYNSLGKYETAAEYSKKAFDISRQMNQRDAIEENRVLCGITKAHKILNNFNANIEIASRKSINNLLRWKYESSENSQNLLMDIDSNDK